MQSPRESLCHQEIPSTDPKLRVSCNNCSASKVKCSKEKPTCTRCARRGVVCKYSEIKRSGRKQRVRLPSNTGSLVNVPSMGSLDLSIPDHSLADLSTLNYRFDDFLDFPFSLSTNEMQDADSLDNPSTIGSLIDLGEDVGVPTIGGSSSAATPSVPELAPSSSSSLQEPIHNYTMMGNELYSESMCCYLVRGLGILNQSHSPLSATHHACNGQDCETNMLSQLSHIHPITAYIDQSIQVVGDLLLCQCSQDGYVLAILAIVILKIMDRYAAMVRRAFHDLENHNRACDNNDVPMEEREFQPEDLHKPPNLLLASNDRTEDNEDEGRMAAQLILGKLHRIQRLVNMISQRLKEPKETSNFSPTTCCNESLLLFPRSSLERIEVDLRKRLRTLSAELIDLLR